MRLNFLHRSSLIVIFFIFARTGFSDVPSLVKDSYGLLTPGYGIVTEDDLAYDAKRRRIGPYDPTDHVGSLYWQCFPRAEVTAKFDSWRGRDGMGAWNKIYTMCTLEVDVNDTGESQIYTDRRAHRIGVCRDFMHAWKKITKDQRIVCLNGDGGGYEQDGKAGKYKLWTWEKFKTKRGCYAYFSGECLTFSSRRKE
jgi:hypothetical protein